MKIIGHRGYWKNNEEKNTEIAFKRCFSLGFGTETDVRDYQGEAMIAHDPPVEKPLTSLDDLLAMAAQANVPLALNIKSNGLAEKVALALQRNPVPGSFVFDMSIPDTLPYLERGVPTFTRLSEYEQEPVLIERAAGILLDCFKEIWFDKKYLTHLLNDLHKEVCLISPELHGRDEKELWGKIKDWQLENHPLLILCTDYVEQAVEFFYEN